MNPMIPYNPFIGFIMGILRPNYNEPRKGWSPLRHRLVAVALGTCTDSGWAGRRGAFWAVTPSQRAEAHIRPLEDPLRGLHLLLLQVLVPPRDLNGDSALAEISG